VGESSTREASLRGEEGGGGKGGGTVKNGRTGSGSAWGVCKKAGNRCMFPLRGGWEVSGSVFERVQASCIRGVKVGWEKRGHKAWKKRRKNGWSGGEGGCGEYGVAR